MTLDPATIRGRLPGFFLLATALLLLGPARPAAAQDDDDAREDWVIKGELSAVLARGNSESLSLGLGTSLRRRWEKDGVRFEAGWVRVETGRITRRAVGSPGDFSVERNVDRERTAESLTARLRYDRTLSERVFGYGAVDWLRNTFAGIDSRFVQALGGGVRWADSDRTRFSTDLAATYTFEADVVDNPFLETDFMGVRGSYELWRQLTATSELESELVADLNLDETDDVRVEWKNALSVDVTDIVALKPSLRLSWRNLPALTTVPLFTASGADTGLTVQAPLRKLDTLFQLALILTL